LVEFALVLPLLLLMLVGIADLGRAFTTYIAITNAAREGCRVAVLEGSTDGDITGRVGNYMQMVGISNYQLTVTHATQADPTETVVVQVPYSEVSLLGGYFGPTNFNIAGRASMRKEGAE